MTLKSKFIALMGTWMLSLLFTISHQPLDAQTFGSSLQLSYASANQLVRDIDINTNGWIFTAGSGQNTSPSTYDGKLSVHDSGQNLKWYIDFIGSGNDEINGVDVISSGAYTAEVYVTGYFTGSMTMVRHSGFPIHDFASTLATINAPSGLSNDATYFVSKFDIDGNHIWTQVAGQVGQNNTEIGNDVSVVQVGATRYVYTTGFWRGATTFTGNTGSVALTADVSFNDAFTACYIDNGTTAGLQWVNKIVVPNKHDYGWALIANPTGDVFVTGSVAGATTATGNGGTSLSLGNIGGDDCYLIKYGSNGNILRSIVFGGDAPSVAPASDCGRGIALGASGRILVSGYYKGNSVALGNAATQDAFLLGFIETGATNFNYSWKDFFRGTGNDALFRIATTADGTVCFAPGNFTGNMVPTYVGVAAATQVPSNPSAPNPDGFFATVNAISGVANGPVVPVWDDTDTDGLTAVATSGNCHARFTGNYRGYFLYDAYLPPFGSAINLTNTSPGTYEAFMFGWNLACKRSGMEEPIAEELEGTETRIFPNPTTGRFTIDLKDFGLATVVVHDIYGKQVLSATEVNASQVALDLSDRPAGTYLVTLRSAHGTKTLRLIKQ